MLGRLPPAAAEALAAPLGELQAAAVGAVAPTFRAVADAGEELLLQMHATPAYAAEGAPAGAGEAVTDTSPCVRDLARLLAHCRLEFLTKFNPSPASPVPSGARVGAGLPAVGLEPHRIATGTQGPPLQPPNPPACLHVRLPRPMACLCACPGLCKTPLPSHPPTPAWRPAAVARALVERLAARLVLFGVRHASLLRPLPQAGKLQLAKARCGAGSPPVASPGCVACTGHPIAGQGEHWRSAVRGAPSSR